MQAIVILPSIPERIRLERNRQPVQDDSVQGELSAMTSCWNEF
jgi:hypothetical protein